MKVALGDHDVLLVDEAGMVGTRALGRLVEVTGQAGGKLVLVGDPRQLPEIEAGGAFAGLIERIGATELVENRRQDHAWERAALDELRHGSPVKGLAAFDGASRIHLGASMAEARGQLVDAWMAATRSGDRSAMLAVNRTDVAALNELARAALRDGGSLGPDVLTVGRLSVAIGDEVVCLRNDRRLEVTNGTRGVVRSADEYGLTVTTDSGDRQLPLEYLADGHLAHGYATTIHKSQGATVDRAFVLATDSLTREAGYVAMSRARKGTELFVPTSAFEDGLLPNERGEGRTDPLHGVGKRLTVSRTKELATDLDPQVLLGSVGNGVESTDSPLGVPMPDLSVARPGTTLFERPEDRYLGPVLGRRPDFLDERQEYDRVARAIGDYRVRFGIEGDEALGRRPFEALQRSAYEAVLYDVLAYQRRLGRSIEMPALSLGRGR